METDKKQDAAPQIHAEKQGLSSFNLGLAPNKELLASKFTPYVVLSAITVSCAGLIFGYNTGISGGVTANADFLQRFFPHLIRDSRAVNQSQYCKFNDQGLQAFTSSLFIAGLVSTFAASHMTKNSGRRPSLIVASLLSLVGVALSAGGQNLPMIIIGRIFLGFGAGFMNQAAPIYLSEIAPTSIRGILGITFQFNIAVGIFVANLVNFAVNNLRNSSAGWRIALACTGVPSIVLLCGALFVVETPISLIERGKLEEGRATLQKIRATSDVDEEFEDMVQVSKNAQIIKENPYRSLLKRKNWPQLIIAIVMALSHQFTGINAVIFYAPVLFQTVGFKSNASLYAAAIIGAVNVTSTIVSMVAVDKMGRKFLLLEGGLQMVISHIVIGVILAITLKDGGQMEIPRGYAVIVVLFICIFIAGFAWSWGPLMWLMCCELFPLQTRSAGQAVVVFVNLAATFAIGQAFLSMLCGMQYGIFIFFAACVGAMSLFVLECVPETKNIPLESISQEMRTNWIWKQVIHENGDVSKAACDA